jgi:hypothetical protein
VLSINMLGQRQRLQQLNDDILVTRMELHRLQKDRQEFLTSLYHPEWGAPVPTPIPINGGPP